MATARAKWRDAFEAQMGLWSWERSQNGINFLVSHYRNTATGLNNQTKEMLWGLYRNETGKVETADPVYVSDEMCELIQAASESFRPEPLYVTDLITDTGFIYFAKPFEVPDRFDQPTTIAAISWAPMVSLSETEQSTLRKMLDSDSAAVEKTGSVMNEWRKGEWSDGKKHGNHGVAITIYAINTISSRPKILPMHITPWWFNMSFEGNEWDETGVPTGAEWWWKVVQTTLRLMQQRIAVRHEERLERPERREAARLKFPDRKVLVMQLRREGAKHGEPSGESANYSHRFIVGGHWRQQWYPASSVHRQIWIAPYVKGPKDKELVIKPRRAFTWDR